jgi:hypothetical protein
MIMENMSLPTEQLKKRNFQAIKNLYGEIDFKLLLNEHTYIQKER